MSYRLLFTDSYTKKAKKFFKKHGSIIVQYEKVLRLLEINPFHPSLRLHKINTKKMIGAIFSINKYELSNNSRVNY